MRAVLTALAVWALLFPGGCSRSAKVESPEIRDLGHQSPEPRDTGQKMVALALTNDRPSASFPLAPEILADAPSILEVSVTKVINSAETPVTIFVYLAPVEKKGQPEPDKILVGNFSLYPPDRPGNFLLSASAALSELRARGVSNSTEMRLMFELKRVRETMPWTPLEIEISAPKWRQEEPKSH